MSIRQHDRNFFHITPRSFKFFLINLNHAVAIAMLFCSFASAQTINDLPCGATSIALGTTTADNNSSAEGSNEPATPGCWTPGVVNSLWYSFIAPPSGQVHVSIVTGSLYTSQIELFSGSCGSLISVSNSCIDYNTARCPGATYTGLTSGATYFIRLDGYNNDVGSYTIVVDDNSGTLTPLTLDCAGAVEICGTFYNSPGNSIGCGNVSDVPSPGNYSNPSTNPICCNSGCLLANELNPRWYRININTSGILKFTLNSGTISCYDWSLWNITNSSCAAIAGNTLAPVRCNWNVPCAGLTGIENPLPPGGQVGNFESPLAVTAGETYILCMTNYSASIANYTLDFTNSTCTIGDPAASQAMITADGPTTFCSGESVVLSVAASGFSYQWKKNGSNISGATLQSYTAKKTGNFTCKVSNSCGFKTSSIISVTVNPKPAVSISAAPCSGGAVLLTCTSDPSTGVKYKWKKDGVKISGATNPTYSATTNGTYKCTVTITATGCKKTTSELSVTINCKIDHTEDARGVTVYPNPSSAAFTFSTSVFDADGEVLICDLTGKLIENHPFFGNDVTAGENFPDGIYLAKIRMDGELIQVMKLVKTR